MPVEYSVKGHVATIVLNRPHAMNALDSEGRAQLVSCIDRIHADDQVRVAIVTGAGDKAFSTGADLKEPPPPDSFAAVTFGRVEQDRAQNLTCDKPLIAAINGYALGGGLELAMACDIRIASETARFALPEAKRGSIPGAGGTQRLPRLIGRGDALYYLLTGDQFDAAEAYRLGLVARVVPAADLMRTAEEIAEKIAGNGPLAIRAIKRLVSAGIELPLETALASERMAFGVLRDTEDRIEGRKAFAEKRAPVYRGR